MSTLLRMYALSGRVLVAAVKGDHGDWTAYVDAVMGHDHEKEIIDVALYGDKLPYEVAKVLFPDLDKRYRWRL